MKGKKDKHGDRREESGPGAPPVRAVPSPPVAGGFEGAAEAPERQDAPPAPPVPEPSVGDKVKEQLEERLLRLQADFENFRKRTQRERSELFLRANEEILKELLPVVDHMDLALESVEKHNAPAGIVEGFRQVGDQLLSVLAKFGVIPLDASGRSFDPRTDEAVAHLPSEEFAANEIMAQVRRGFLLGDRLLRPAQVVVSNGKGSASSSTADEEAEAAGSDEAVAGDDPCGSETED